MNSYLDQGFGLYIHWPFCQAKCPYCDFNSHVAANIDQDLWAECYLKEIDRVSDFTSDRILSSVFFGGGTPSLMDPLIVERILDRIQKSWRFTNDVEITLEANPSSVEADHFAGYRQAGVNRVSLGVQALIDDDLKRLGRLHSVKEALNALDIARNSFDRMSFDLIYARQDQSLADWQDELERAFSFEPSHLSLYQLTIEDGTAFGARYARGLLRGLPNDDLSADMFLWTQEATRNAGLTAYEVSNHARTGHESRHNLIYWRGGDYLGIGPGAHGRYSLDGARIATETHLAPGKWLAAVKNGESGQSVENVITKEDQALEYLLMSLRLQEGTSLTRLDEISPNVVNFDKINELVALGFVSVEQKKLKVPPEKRVVLNKILEELVT